MAGMKQAWREATTNTSIQPKMGRTTVKHPDKDIPIKTLKRIEEQSGLKFK